MTDENQDASPRYRILIWKDGLHTGTLAMDGSPTPKFLRVVAECTHTAFNGGAYRVELFDGPDLIDQWASHEA